jgi:hypothetical protein
MADGPRRQSFYTENRAAARDQSGFRTLRSADGVACGIHAANGPITIAPFVGRHKRLIPFPTATPNAIPNRQMISDGVVVLFYLLIWR